MIVVGGSASAKLAAALARELNVKLAKTEVKKFPDSETYVRIFDSVKGEDVVLVQNGYPDDKIIEMMLLQDAVEENGGKSLISVIPYYGYARQDKKFNSGEPVSARSMAGHFELDCDEVITVDIHSEGILDWFDVDVKNVTAMHEIGKSLKNREVDIVVSPDQGGIERAKTAAIAADCDFDYLEKKRLDANTVEMKPLKSDVSGQVVAIVDDIISTGGTIMAAATQLKSRGAKAVYAACTHGLFIGDSLARLLNVCDEIISTDTLENPATLVSVAPEIAKAIKR
jgi:ribose-phosphate pyrophosphokinase